MSTLAFKFGSLLLRQLSKPVASRVKEFVLKHPRWRKRALDLARAVHRWEVFATASAKSGDAQRKIVVGEMLDDRAIELASNMVSEGFVFSVAAVLLIIEYTRNQASTQKKQEIEERKRQELHAESARQRQTLMRENQHQYEIIAELQQRVERLEEEIKMRAESKARKSWWQKSNGASISAHLEPPSPDLKDKAD